MKRKGWIATMLAIALLGGCASKQPAETTGTTTHATATPPTTQPAEYPADAPLEDRLPTLEGERLRMYYDDRYAISQLGGETAQITEQKILSNAVGTTKKDTAVVVCESGELIAVGIGTAQVTVGDAVYEVSVEAAPISLVMITGHSIGAGATGVPGQSVLCNAGQAYSTHYQDLNEAEAAGVGIGYASSKKPADIDAFTAAGSGTPGEASGLAYRWNAITGEKIWILNAAKGGTCLNEWVQGTEHYNKAVSMFRYAEAVLANEIAAGHYRLKDMAILYHSGANFGYKGVTFTDELGKECYTSLWEGLKRDLRTDLNGDGAEETVTALGLVPIWTESGRKTYSDDVPTNYFMAASAEYPDIFMASEATRIWCSASGVKEFPEIDYMTHGEEALPPKTVSQVFSDGVHLIQPVYNALGMDIAENLFAYLRTYRQVVSVSFQKPDGNKVYGDVSLGSNGDYLRIVPVLDPITVSDLTFTLTDNLAMEYPGKITVVGEGEGKVTVSQGNQVLAEIVVWVED